MSAAHELELFPEGADSQRPWIAPLLGATVLALDPSLTGFALCMHVPGRELIEGRWSSAPAESVQERCERYGQLILGTLEAVLAHAPGLVLIEGYAFQSGKKKQHQERGHHDRAELGGVLRWELCKRVHCPILEVAPTSLKKFACGDGKAPKSFVVSELAKTHQRRFTTDDQADAFALCQLGLALTGQCPPPTTKLQRGYLEHLRKLYGLGGAL